MKVLYYNQNFVYYQKVKFIDKKDFTKVVLIENIKAFVIYLIF